MTKHTLRPCPVCHEKDADILHAMDFVLAADSPLPLHYNIVACRTCAFVYADTPASQADYDRYYAQFSKYDDPSISTGGGDSRSDQTRIEETAELIITQTLADRSANACILDIGCARGGLLLALKKRGWPQVTGMDPSPACVTHLTSIGIPALQGTLSASSLPTDETFDLIILSHVMEHVLDITNAIVALKKLLAPQGRLYIEVPDASRYVEHPVVPFYYFDAEHINHFDQASLHNLAACHGFVVLSSGEKIIRLVNESEYPAVWACLTPGDPTPLKPATELRYKIMRYIEQSTANSGAAKLSALAATQEPVVLWGAGSYAQRLLADLHSPLSRCNIIGIIDKDSNKQGKQLSGIIITGPESLSAKLSGHETIVIAAALYSEQIIKEIRAMGINNPVTTP